MSEIKLGYACISVKLRPQGIFTSRTMTLKTLEKSTTDDLKELAKKNLNDLMTILKYNEENGLRFFRITSNLFPHMENPLSSKKYTLTFAKKLLYNIGQYAIENNHRLTMHPGQYVQLGSIHDKVAQQSIRELTLHANILNTMNLTPDINGSVLIIHGGGTYGNKELTLKRWENRFKLMPLFVQQYVVIENDEWCYSVMDLLPLSEQLEIPICIDFFHHEIGHKHIFNIFDEQLIERVMAVWKKRKIRPKFHWSDQAIGERKGTHGECPSTIPKNILDIAVKYNGDIMIESKGKDNCTLKLYKKYFKQIEKNGKIHYIL